MCSPHKSGTKTVEIGKRIGETHSATILWDKRMKSLTLILHDVLYHILFGHIYLCRWEARGRRIFAQHIIRPVACEIISQQPCYLRSSMFTLLMQQAVNERANNAFISYNIALDFDILLCQNTSHRDITLNFFFKSKTWWLVFFTNLIRNVQHSGRWAALVKKKKKNSNKKDVWCQ